MEAHSVRINTYGCLTFYAGGSKYIAVLAFIVACKIPTALTPFLSSVTAKREPITFVNITPCIDKTQ